MSKLIYSLFLATFLIVSAAPASANELWDNGDRYGGYEPGSTAAARAFWERMNNG